MYNWEGAASDDLKSGDLLTFCEDCLTVDKRTHVKMCNWNIAECVVSVHFLVCTCIQR